MLKFEWDAVKAAANLKKHGVSFEEAMTVFEDFRALSFADTDHSNAEERSRVYGISHQGRLLVVVHTERRGSIRIISSRKATKYEKSIYEAG